MITAVAAGYQMTTPIAPGVHHAGQGRDVHPISTLNLNFGYPDDATTQKVYDNLDAWRALQACLLPLPMVNPVGMRAKRNEFRPVNQTDVIRDDLVASKTV